MVPLEKMTWYGWLLDFLYSSKNVLFCLSLVALQTAYMFGPSEEVQAVSGGMYVQALGGLVALFVVGKGLEYGFKIPALQGKKSAKEGP